MFSASRHLAVVLILSFFLLSPFSLLHAAERRAEQRPNILYIMSDDHGAQAIGAYGGRLASLDLTPHIDRLAREGLRFDRAFVGNSICTPSRATILTGQHSQANGVLDLAGKLPPDRQDLPRLLRAAGYATAIVGKWHLGSEPVAFDYYKVLPGQGDYINPTFHEKGRGAFPKNTVQDTGHSSDVITDSALTWLKSRDATKPFFFALHYKAPHGLWQNAPRYDRYLEEVAIPEPEYDPFDRRNHGSIATRGDRDELLPYIGSSVGRRNRLRNQLAAPAKLSADSALSDRDLWRASYQAYLKAYLRCVKGVDDNIGRVYDYLAGAGLLENTVIVYTSDQGMWLGEHDYIDKRWMYEESMRTPLIVRYPPAIEPGATSTALVSNIDFAPTFLDFAGAAVPAAMHGRSLRPLFATNGRAPADWRTSLYYRYWMHLNGHQNPAHFGLRTDRYKLIFFYGIDVANQGVRTPPAWEFYDLETDPHELDNRYAYPAHAAAIAGLKRELLQLRERYAETDAKYPHIQAIVDAHWETTPASHAEAIRISHDARAAFAAGRGAPKKNKK